MLATIEFSKALVSAFDMETLLTAILERIKAILPAQNWSLLLIDPQARDLYFAVVVGLAPEMVKNIRLRLGKGSPAPWPRRGQPIFIPDVDQDPRSAARVDVVTGFETRSIIALPLIVRGEVIGVFEVVNVEDEKFFREAAPPDHPGRLCGHCGGQRPQFTEARGPHLYRRSDGILQYAVSHPRTGPPHPPGP